ncbi:MAG TPA: transglutaminase family protein, partial [Caulobacteraceae bacterium]|nr:transglutaminase family protein [Caulobacteraceae bacterium]
TREGDMAGVDELQPPDYHWALPLRPGGAPLERIVQPPMDKPMLDVAWTVNKHDPVTKGESEDPEGLSARDIARYRVRASWPSADPVHWRATEGMPQPVTTTSNGRSTLLVDVANIKSPIPPAGAPFRYSWVGRLYGSSFASWEVVSATIAPLFEQAATLSASSPLRAEAQAIAARSADPKARAFAALQLVEDKIRYFYIGTNDGGYVPAAADLTWQRRFGDCKGKTVVLLALLRQLGVEAEPALVSTSAGDGLDKDLPGLDRFDHVLIRAVIGGKTYWLDGTREGDLAGVDELQPPDYHWALPLRPGGAPLEHIVQSPMDKPMLDVSIRLDASKGLDAPAKAELRMIMRGDAAVGLRTAVARAAKDDLIRAEKQAIANSTGWFDPKTVDWKDDPQANTFELDMAGDADMVWRDNPDLHVKEYRFPGTGAPTSPKMFPVRDGDVAQDAPFVVPFPMYVKATIAVVLPDGGRNFTVSGQNVDETIAQLHVISTTTLVAGVARFDGSVRSLAPEATAAEAAAANKEMLQRSGEETGVIRLWPAGHVQASSAAPRTGA